eukprot:5148156-Amphidinium_carterae.1
MVATISQQEEREARCQMRLLPSQEAKSARIMHISLLGAFRRQSTGQVVQPRRRKSLHTGASPAQSSKTAGVNEEEGGKEVARLSGEGKTKGPPTPSFASTWHAPPTVGSQGPLPHFLLQLCAP